MRVGTALELTLLAALAGCGGSQAPVGSSVGQKDEAAEVEPPPAGVLNDEVEGAAAAGSIDGFDTETNPIALGEVAWQAGIGIHARCERRKGKGGDARDDANHGMA